MARTEGKVYPGLGPKGRADMARTEGTYLVIASILKKLYLAIFTCFMLLTHFKNLHERVYGPVGPIHACFASMACFSMLQQEK